MGELAAIEEKAPTAPDVRPQPLPSPPESTHADTDADTEEDLKDIEYEIPLPPPPNPAPVVLDVDKNTPDGHVPRDPRLIRLTGVHPFNVEAPLTALFNEGFLTSPELFYVRNHGAVPEVRDDQCLDWEFTVEGYCLHSHMTYRKC
jgi:nitrate reductase (NAD(P)H)